MQGNCSPIYKQWLEFEIKKHNTIYEMTKKTYTPKYKSNNIFRIHMQNTTKLWQKESKKT